MKYSKIAKLIKKSKRLIIHTDGKEQWISDGAAVYPVLGMPKMSETEMLTFLNFQDNDKINVTEWNGENAMLSDTDPNEELIESFGPTILVKDEKCVVFYTSIGALIINENYLTPVLSHYSEGEPTFYFRCTNGKPYIAVKKGLYLLAAILPFRTWELGNSLFIDKYCEFCNMLKLTENNMKLTEEEGKEVE